MAKSEGGRPADRSQPVPGAVDPETLYRADELKSRMGWRDSAFRSACRNGLRVHRAGKRAYVLGADAVSFVTKGGGDQ
jgi:hypothetical protein